MEQRLPRSCPSAPSPVMIAVPPPPSLPASGERGSRWRLGRHLAHKVALADIDTEAAQDVVRSRDVEVKVRHREVVEVDLGAEIARLAALGDRDLRIFLAVELVRPQTLEEPGRLVERGVHVGVTSVDGGEALEIEPGGAPGGDRG